MVPPCTGSVFTFKNTVYFDLHFEYVAGFLVGYCTVVADHPDIEPYCVYTTVLDYEVDHTPFKAEIAVAGGSIVGQTSTFLITAAAGEYEGEEGTLTTSLIVDEVKGRIQKLEFEFY